MQYRAYVSTRIDSASISAPHGHFWIGQMFSVIPQEREYHYLRDQQTAAYRPRLPVTNLEPVIEARLSKHIMTEYTGDCPNGISRYFTVSVIRSRRIPGINRNIWFRYSARSKEFEKLSLAPEPWQYLCESKICLKFCE